jgi:hypothetical protein
MASVDTDADSGLDDEFPVPFKPETDGHIGTKLDELGFEDELEVEDFADNEMEQQQQVDIEEQRRHRHPPGTWKIWDGTWFYITKTPGWIDIKCWVKWQFRSVGEGMGTSIMSRTLTPHHYGDDWNNPWRSLLLLRSWTIWRARLHGWARAKDCRLRDVARQMDRFVIDLRTAHQEHNEPLAVPLLGSTAAHELLLKWAPDAVTRVLS